MKKSTPKPAPSNVLRFDPSLRRGGRRAGELTEEEIIASPAWGRLCAEMLSSLKTHPKALLDVARRLDSIEHRGETRAQARERAYLQRMATARLFIDEDPVNALLEYSGHVEDAAQLLAGDASWREPFADVAMILEQVRLLAQDVVFRRSDERLKAARKFALPLARPDREHPHDGNRRPRRPRDLIQVLERCGIEALYDWSTERWLLEPSEQAELARLRTMPQRDEWLIVRGWAHASPQQLAKRVAETLRMHGALIVDIVAEAVDELAVSEAIEALDDRSPLRAIRAALRACGMPEKAARKLTSKNRPPQK